MKKNRQNASRRKVRVLLHRSAKPLELKRYKIFREPEKTTLPPFGPMQEINTIRTLDLPKTLQAYMAASNHKITPAKDLDTKSSLKTANFSETEEIIIGLYCKCRRPYAQGELMFKCEGPCQNWYHPQCLRMKKEEINKQKDNTLDWFCPKCIGNTKSQSFVTKSLMSQSTTIE